MKKLTINHGNLLLAVLIVAMVSFTSGCTSSIPGSASITPPSAEIPQQMAIFSGCWKGTFQGEGGGTRSTTLAVAKINSPDDVEIVYGYGAYLYSNGNRHYNDGKSGTYNLKAHFVGEDTLLAKFPSGSSVVYTANDDGTLKAEYMGKYPSTAIMKRVAVEN